MIKWSAFKSPTPVQTKKLGEVGDPDRKMVDVRVDEDPSPAIYERVKQALTRLGFSVQPYSGTMDRTLAIEIRTLELQSVKRPLTFNTELRAEVATNLRCLDFFTATAFWQNAGGQASATNS